MMVAAAWDCQGKAPSLRTFPPLLAATAQPYRNQMKAGPAQPKTSGAEALRLGNLP